MSTRGTAAFLAGHGVECQVVNKVYEGRPNVIDHIKNGDIQLVINTSSGKRTKEDSSELRRTTVMYGLGPTRPIWPLPRRWPWPSRSAAPPGST